MPQPVEWQNRCARSISERVEKPFQLPRAARHGHAFGRRRGRAPAGAALVVADRAEARRQPVDERADAHRPAALRQQHRQRRAAAALLIVDVAAVDVQSDVSAAGWEAGFSGPARPMSSNAAAEPYRPSGPLRLVDNGYTI